MRANPRHLIALLLVALLAGGCGGQPESGGGGLTDAEPDVSYDLVIEDGGVVGGPQTFSVDSGDVVRLSIESDQTDALHVHGVDVEVEVEAGETTDVTFETGATGSYEVELHDAAALVGTLEVR